MTDETLSLSIFNDIRLGFSSQGFFPIYNVFFNLHVTQIYWLLDSAMHLFTLYKFTFVIQTVKSKGCIDAPAKWETHVK